MSAAGFEPAYKDLESSATPLSYADLLPSPTWFGSAYFTVTIFNKYWSESAFFTVKYFTSLFSNFLCCHFRYTFQLVMLFKAEVGFEPTEAFTPL